MANNFRLEGDLTTRLNQMGPKIKRAMVASGGLAATQAESFMKSEAPWTDQTGAARNGLKAQLVVSTNKVALVMYHSVPYGVFLEVRWGGKYGVIPAAMAAVGPFWVEALSRIMWDDI